MVLVNGVECDSVNVHDRALHYGDGVFRTFRADNGVVNAWSRQFAKFKDDCERLALPSPEKSTLEADLAKVLAAHPDTVVKMMLTRGIGKRGYSFDPTMQTTRIVMASPIPQYPAGWAEQGVKVRVCDVKLASQPRLAGVKHLNRLENVLARSEWQESEFAEGLMLDFNGNVIAGTMTNLFIAARGVVATPDLSRCGVAGVTRERILDFARSQGIPVEVRDIALDELLNADEVLLANSVIGVWRVRELRDKRWNEARFTPAVKSKLCEHES
jgi:4-amino-4-deoxychorismate lyase